MISTRFVKLAVSGLALGLSLTGGHSLEVAPSASSPETKQLQIAAEAAAKANAALANQNYRSAVRFAETAVEFAPRNAAYRMMLGQAYLGAGRFASAETSFADTLTLMPDNSRAALNLALTEIAQGKRDKALSTLADYREKLAVSDYGLAIGLAGDVENAITTLESAIRGGENDAKTRQNLALSYAMAGRWPNARVMAMQDLSGNDVNDRIAQWASFVRPGSSFDQVASLLGVKPAEDAGQPTRLALNGFVDTAVAAAAAEAVPAPVAEIPAPVQTAMAEPQPEPAAVPATFETPVATPNVVPSGTTMGERREVVQPLPASYSNYAKPAPTIRAAAGPVKQVIVPKSKPKPAITAAAVQPKPAMRGVEAGKFVVQLGAFENAAVSRDAWKRLSARFGLANYDPANAPAKFGGTNFVRLSVGGFVNRAEANGVCTRIRNAGGTCFVRGLLGDTPAQWVQRGMPKAAKPVRMASR
jgi:Flp pilus assembly protein TadD/cell division septation protein DedD